jgi:hypothetical protein
MQYRSAMSASWHKADIFLIDAEALRTCLNVTYDPIEKNFSWAECVFEGDEFDELNELLSDRLPV